MGLDDIRDESRERRSIQEPQPQQEDVLEDFDLRKDFEEVINSYKEKAKLLEEELLKKDNDSENGKSK